MLPNVTENKKLGAKKKKILKIKKMEEKNASPSFREVIRGNEIHGSKHAEFLRIISE